MLPSGKVAADVSTLVSPGALDEWLANRDARWRGSDKRLQQAARLLQLTFDALALSEDPRAHLVSERLAADRHGSLVSAVRELSATAGPVNDAGYGEWLSQRSFDRRHRRLAAVGVDPSAVSVELDWLAGQLPSVPVGQAVLLTGPFGSGKSEIAEGWHRESISAFLEGGLTPVWIPARTAGDSLEARVLEHAGPLRIRLRGVALVVDGLDEVDVTTARSLIGEAHSLIAGDTRSRALLTSRALHNFEDERTVEAKGFQPEVAQALIERLAGRRVYSHGWQPDLAATVRRPFFAMACASFLRNEQSPGGQAELTAHLAEQALVTADAPTVELQAALETCAQALTDSNGGRDNLSFAQRQRVLATSLVAGTPGETLAFSLPIFEQWFAAQALLTNTTLVHRATSSPQAFDRWRWVLALAAQRASPDRADDIIERCFDLNPGAGAWIVHEVSAGTRPLRAADDEPAIDPQDALTRYARVSATWRRTLGPEGLWFIGEHAAHPRSWGITASGRILTVALRGASSTSEETWELLPESRNSDDDPDTWQFARGGIAPRGHLWPWIWYQQSLAGAGGRRLKSALPIVDPQTVWEAERHFATARQLLNRPRTQPIPQDDVEHALAEVMAGTARSTVRITPQHLLQLDEWLRRRAPGEIENPVPAPDSNPTSSLIDHHYSSVLAANHALSMLDNACRAHDEIRGHLLGAFSWSLDSSAAAPLGMVARLDVPENVLRRGDGYWIEYCILPLDAARELAAQERGWRTGPSGRAWIYEGTEPLDLFTDPRLRDGYQLRLEAPAGRLQWTPTITTSVLDLTSERPASQIAVSLIWRDLQALGLASGITPHLS